MRILRRLNITYVCALFGGGLLVFSFPAFDFFPLAWIAFIPLLVSLYGKPARQTFRAGFFLGLIYFFGTLYWIYHSIHYYGSISFIPSLAIVFLLCMYLSLYPALFCVLYSAVITRTDLPALLVAPVFWTALEFLRSYALSGFPWSSLGYSQHSFLIFIQSADIVGIYGIGFFVMALNGAIADIFIMKKRMMIKPLYSSLPTFAGWSLVIVAIIANFSYGAYRLYQDRPGANVKVAVVQGNIEQDKKWDVIYQQNVIETYQRLTLSAASSDPEKPGPDLIVWPETAVPFFFGAHAEMSEELVNFQSGLNSYLLFGSVRLKSKMRGPSESYSNSTVLLTKSGKPSYYYDKMHLVPFGEYVPLRKMLFFVDKLVVGVGDYMPGDSYAPAITPFGIFATPVCYEIIFPGQIRKYYRKGGDFIVNVTNDAWFGTTNGPNQHFSMAVFRAIENRKPVVRAANTGISGFIDSNGRVLQVSPLFQQAVLQQDLRTDKSMTFYTRYGDLFSFFCIVMSLLFLMKINKKQNLMLRR